MIKTFVGSSSATRMRGSTPAFYCDTSPAWRSWQRALLVWSWIANWQEQPSLPTVVRWELIRTKDGTHARVTHTGLSQEQTARKDYGGGWQGVLKLLTDFLHEGLSD
jgi:hypothetical protein